MITPGYLDLVIYQGATFDQTVDVELDGVAWNLTTYTGTLLAKTAAATTAAITLTSGSGRTLGNGTITLAMTATETAALTEGRIPYQVEVVNGSTVHRALEGTIRVLPEVTV